LDALQPPRIAKIRISDKFLNAFFITLNSVDLKFLMLFILY